MPPHDRRDIRRALLKKGFREETKGRDHDVYILETDGKVRAVFTKLSRGTAYHTIGDNLLSKIARQLQVSRPELNDLIACPMDRETYLSVLADRGVLDL